MRNLTVNNIQGALLTMEGMCNKETLAVSVVNPILDIRLANSPAKTNIAIGFTPKVSKNIVHDL